MRGGSFELLISLFLLSGLGCVSPEPAPSAPASSLDPRVTEVLADLDPPHCETLRESGAGDAGPWLAEFSGPRGARWREWLRARVRAETVHSHGAERRVLPRDDELLKTAEHWIESQRCTFYEHVWPIDGFRYPTPNLEWVRLLGHSWLVGASDETSSRDRLDVLQRVVRLGCHALDDDASLSQTYTGVALLVLAIEDLIQAIDVGSDPPLAAYDATLAWCRRARELMGVQQGFLAEIGCRAAQEDAGLFSALRPARNMTVSDAELEAIVFLSHSGAARGIRQDALWVLQSVRDFGAWQAHRDRADAALRARTADSDVVLAAIARLLVEAPAVRPECISMLGGKRGDDDGPGAGGVL